VPATKVEDIAETGRLTSLRELAKDEPPPPTAAVTTTGTTTVESIPPADSLTDVKGVG
jgi:hypothetical protein